ncbi:ABC transporter permease [Streptomyces sp. NPDC002537]
MSTTLTTATKSETGKRPPRVLRGMGWLVWRQHRTALLACLLLTAAATVNMLWQRAATMDFVEQARAAATAVDPREAFQGTSYSSALQDGASTMAWLPALLGAFLGAPLITGDLERGTFKLVTTQSMTRRHWLTVKIGTAALVAVLCSTVLSAVYTSWWRPVRDITSSEWTQSSVYDTTGPVPVAMTLLYLAGGIACGVAVRRVLPAVVATFGFFFVVQMVWDRVRLWPFTPRVLTNPVEQGQPKVPAGGARFDNWTVDAHGGLHGFGTCFNERSAAACRADKGIVAERLEYFGYDQMNAMQWVSAAILLAAAVAIAGLTLWWVRRRPL